MSLFIDTITKHRKGSYQHQQQMFELPPLSPLVPPLLPYTKHRLFPALFHARVTMRMIIYVYFMHGGMQALLSLSRRLV